MTQSTTKVTQGAADSPASASHPPIGHYRVSAQIGKGGMGEVWQATDTKLGREVAIKLLPGIFAGDPIRLTRVKREAQLLASLNHPGIAAIYGIEESAENGAPALVMELIDGPTLGERIAAGPIPIDEALSILRQIAEALEYAHEHGVVHRDLKPANIKITSQGQVKVLDFGLAKAMAPDEASGDMSNSPTLSLAMTEAGLLLGTAAYMSPEQAKGKPADRRADIWAFGCVAFEMLARKKAFDGETVSDILAAVIMGEPDWSALPPATPASIQRLLRRCLKRDLRQRLQAIGDARIAIEETLAGGAEAGLSGEIAASQPGMGGRKTLLGRALPWALGTAAVLFAASTAWLMLRPKPQQDLVRFSIPPPENAEFLAGGEMSLSPDGRNLAFVTAARAGTPQVLWLRSLDSLTARQVPGTEDASAPFWSPDSQQIGFVANGKLEKIAVTGGAPQVLCDAEGLSATWNRDGIILFTTQGSLYRVPDTGGTPALALAPAPSHSYGYPQFLPDGRHFIFLDITATSKGNFVAVSSLDSKTVERLTQADSKAIFAPPGYLFYPDRRTLMARPFDAKGLQFTGAAVPVAQNIGTPQYTNYAYFSVSQAGNLAYQVMGSSSPGLASSLMIWFNRAGVNLGTVGNPAIYSAPALSADGTRLAVALGAFGQRDIWVYDLKRGTASRLTFNASDDTNSAWSSNGDRIVFSSNRDGQFDIYQKAADGLGSEQPVFLSKDQGKHVDDVSSDGRYLIYDTAVGNTELWGLPLFGDHKPFAFIQGNFRAICAQFSPNGRYVAYASTETGSLEIYVQTFPQQTGKWQISTSGGNEPMWGRDGKELFYLSLDGKLMAVDVSANAATFQSAIPKPLFQTQLNGRYPGRTMYVVSPDAQRFLMIVPAGTVKAEPITVVVNWPALLQHSGGR